MPQESSPTVSPPRVYSSREESYTGKIMLCYALLFLLGFIGAHKFYVGKPGVAWFYILLTIAGFFTVGLAWIVLLIALFIDLFKLPNQVKYS